MTGKERLIAALKRMRPAKELPPPEAATSSEAWTQYKIKQIEQQQQWLLLLLGGEISDVVELLSLF